ncbi:protein IWS1 homolog isoform X2 [Saccostrea cucullata]|uniref:protein IWS1 homolog isoform X2 n=1 Tax=Saccostrea cuccullata TaxID=36930 RepID=UPI002ED30E7A
MVLESKTQKVNRDPFAVKPLPKAHYHPSKHKYLSKSQRKTALGSPLKQEDKGDKQPSVEDEVFLKGGNRYLTKTPPPDDNASSKFDESWPSSERPSSVGLTGTDDRSPYSLHKMLDLYGKRTEDYSDVKQTLSFTETDLKGPPGEGASTLQRYVERFRRGEPMSREERERQTAASSKDFWWIDPSKSDNDDRKTPTVGKVAEGSPSDKLTQQLQDRADRLLERSVSTVASSEPIVSTDGLGSSYDGTISSFEEQPYRPAFAKNFDAGPPRTQYPGLSREPGGYSRDVDTAPIFPRPTKPARPEDDILHQWRVKRRLESARDKADKAPANKNTFGFLSQNPDEEEVKTKLSEFKERLSGKRPPKEPQRVLSSVQFTPSPVPSPNFAADQSSEYQPKLEQKYGNNIPPIASPTLGRRGKQTGVEPHLHLMCDLLPCQHSQQYVGKTPRSPTTERSKQEGRQSKISQSSRSEDNNCKGESESSDLEEKTGRYKYLEAERPDVEATKPKTSESENRTKESASDIPKRKKNHESQHVKSDVKHSSKSRAQEDEAEGEENIPRPRECHSPSMKRFESVNSAIGQVIKDRLFTSSLSTVIDSVDNSLLDQNRQSVEITESTRISPPELSPPDPKPPSGLSAPDSRVKEKQRTGTQKERKVKTGSVPEEAGKGQNLAELENEESYESDGEFPEDQLLQILRAQRSQFEQQLGHIDKLLQKLSPLS